MSELSFLSNNVAHIHVVIWKISFTVSICHPCLSHSLVLVSIPRHFIERQFQDDQKRQFLNIVNKNFTSNSGLYKHLVVACLR